MSRMFRRMLLGTLSVTIGIIAGAILTEGVARKLYTEPWYEKLIGEQYKSSRIPYWENHLGFRDFEYSSVKPAHTYRILILGDSFTYGIGVADEQNIFPEILKKRLNELDFGEKTERVEVLNAGIPGSVTEDWLAVVEEHWADFNPDAVLIVYFLRDGLTREHASIPSFFYQIRQDIVRSNQESRFYRTFYTFRFVKDELDKRRISQLYVKEFINAYLGNEQQTAVWKQSQSTLLKIRDYARERSAKVAFVIFPILVQLDERYPFLGVCKNIEAFSKRNGMPTYNLLTTFTGFQGPELWVSPYDQHPNERAHRMVAEALEPFVAAIVRGGN